MGLFLKIHFNGLIVQDLGVNDSFGPHILDTNTISANAILLGHAFDGNLHGL
jgi:hypothetical protein